jgi:antitoxin component YwqK of YwqJK toxin-antitoxin module
MKTSIVLIFNFLFFFNSFAQPKFERPPKFPPKEYRKIKTLDKINYYFGLGELKQNSDSLYCWKTKNNCSVIDGQIKLFAYYSTIGDNQSLIPYTCSEGEFLEGKHQGIWKYYDKNGKVTKKEKWDNGNLIYRKEYNFNTCDNLEGYKFSNIKLSEDNSIEQFKKDFSIKSEKLVCKNGIIKNMRLIFRDETTIQFIRINNGLTGGHEIQIDNDPIPSGKSYYYDKDGNVKAMSEIKNELSKGNGHYIDYYYPKKNESIKIRTIPILKGEGEVKNNLKYGEWRYYNKNGLMDSTKTYTLKDSVDVRFPHCIFNKKEPCYCEKK